MCIIAIKPAGVAKPTTEQFKAMIDGNPNGFGYMTWSKDKGLQVHKTMDRKQYLKWVEKIPDEQPVVYHMRIATHGSVQTKNCHPFIDATKKWAFAHNGILSIRNEGDMTDSETFFKRIAMPFIYAGIKPKSKPFDKMIEAIIGSSKFVFLNNEGKLFVYGSFIKEGGLSFSNTSYQPRIFTGWGCGTLYGSTWKGRNMLGDFDDDYDYYNDYWRKSSQPPQTQSQPVPLKVLLEDMGDKKDCTCSEYIPTDKEWNNLVDYIALSCDDDPYFCNLTYKEITEQCKSEFPWVKEEDVKDILDDFGVEVNQNSLFANA